MSGDANQSMEPTRVERHRRSEAEVADREPKLTHVLLSVILVKLRNTFPAGMEPTVVERHRRSPKGE